MHQRNGPTILAITCFYLLTCVVQWGRVDAELICPAYVGGNSPYTATAEWYNNGASNLLQRASLYVQGRAQAYCCAVNLTCTLQDTFLQYSKLISMTIVAMNKDYKITCSVMDAATNFITMAGNYTVTWQLQYGTYSESCALSTGKAVDECSSPTGTGPTCLNNGVCSDIESGFNCKCKSGYFGYICDHSEDQNQACTSSSSQIVLWENMTSPQMSIFCQNISVYRNISDLVVLKQFPSDILRSVLVTNNTTVAFSLNVFQYRPGVYNFVMDILLIDRYFHQLVTVFVYNPPKFQSHFIKKTLRENVTAGTEVLNMTAVTDNVPSALSYSLADTPAGAFLFSVDNTGIIRVAQHVLNSLSLFNISLKVFDTLTNQSDTATIEVNISDVNQPPVCVNIISVTFVNITASKIMLGQITCKDPDRTEEYSKLSYSVKAEPSSVKVTIDGNGSVILTDQLSNNITSFIVYVTVQDIEFKVYSNFTVFVRNDFPSCNVSKDVLFLWETKTSDVIQLICDTIEPGNIHNLTFYGASAVPLDIFNVVTITDKNIQTLGFNISLLNYVPFTYNVTLILFVNGVQINKEITIFVFNPPKFSTNFRQEILQNVTVGTTVLIAPAISKNAVTYSLIQSTSSSDPSSYFSVDGNGIIKVNQIINNNLVSQFNLTLQAKDSVTNQTSTTIIDINILDVNEPPVCDLMFSVKSVNTSVVTKMLAHVTCKDPDKSENLTKLYYSVKAEPKTVNLTIDDVGNVVLSNQLPLNITSFVVYVTVRDIDFEVYSNFTVLVINDFPFCSVSKSVLVLSETQRNDVIQLICETIEPGNIHNFTFFGASTVPENILNVTVTNISIQTVGYNISLWKYVPSTCNVTLIFFVNGLQVTKEITVFVSNPPMFPLSFIETILQNVTVGATILSASALSDHALYYSLSRSAYGPDPTLYFSVDGNGFLKVNQTIPNVLLSRVAMALQAKDSVTNQTSTTSIEINIIDVNEPPVCDLMFSVKSVNTTTSYTFLGEVSCTDSDRNVEFTRLNYSVKAVPTSVNVNIDQYGNVWLSDQIPYNVSSFVVYISVRDYSFEVYVNFTVQVINDVPYCVMSKNTSVLSNTRAVDLVYMTCDTLNPGNIHNWTSPQTYVSCPGIVQVVTIERNLTIELNISLTTYSPTKCNISTTVIINGQPITKDVTALVYKRPEFVLPSASVHILQNITKGSEIHHIMAISDSPGPLSYSLVIPLPVIKGIPLDTYFNMNETTGIIRSAAEIPNFLVGTYILTLKITDKLTNLSGTAQLNVTIEDVNEPPQCNMDAVMPIYSTSPPGTYISRIICSDNDVTQEFKKVKYSVKIEPNVVQLTVNQTGHIMLSAPFPANINSFDVILTVEDLDLRLYFNFTVIVLNDLPYCSLSKNSLLLSETNTRGFVNLTCDTINPGNVHSLSFFSLDLSCRESVQAHYFEINLTTLGFNFSMLTYRPSQCKVILNVLVNGLEVEMNISVLVYNPPKLHSTTAYILQNITIGTQVANMSAISDSPGQLEYRLLKNTSESMNLETYFKIDESTGIVWSDSNIPNSLVGPVYLTVKVNDTFTNLSSTAQLNVNIEDVNEQPQCHISDVMPINSSTPPGAYISQVICSDTDVLSNFTRLMYSVKADPSSIQVNITEKGKIYLLSKPDNVKIIHITVTVTDFSYTVTVSYDHTTNEYYCPGDGITNVTLAGSIVTVPCPANYTGNFTRACHSNLTWGDFSFINCTRKSLQTVTAMASEIVANQAAMNATQLNQQILDIATELNSTFSTQKPEYSGDLKQTLNVLENISVVVEKQNLTVQDDTLKKLASVTNNLLLADTNLWSDLNNQQQNYGSALIFIMDYFATSSLSTINNDSLILRDSLAIVRGATSEDISFPKSNLQANVLDWTTTFENKLFLPKEAFSGTSPIKYSVIAYKDISEKFQINQTLQNEFSETKYLSFGSEILTFSVNTNEAIKRNLQLMFQVTNVSEKTKPNCGFLNTSKSEFGVWSTRGCTLESFINHTVNCSCNHLTNFAILMSPFQVETESSVVLSIISTIGCAISIFCLAVTIFVYILVWRHVKNDRSVLHMNLCVCLIICYILFLAGVDKSDDEVGCKVVAALLHFFYLVVFFTMFSEGLHIFKAVVFVFKKDSMLHILFPFIYGVPLVIVAVSLGVTKTEGYVSNEYCWLSVNKGLIWAFVGPVLLILLCNFIILLITLRIMQSTAVHRLKTKSEKLRSVVRTIFLLSPVLGLTWVFGVLSVNSDLIVFQYLFAILNSLQGFFVFLCYCVLTHQIREGLSKMKQRSQSKSIDSGTRSTDSSNGELVTQKGKPVSDYENIKPVIKMNPAFRDHAFGMYGKSD